MSKNVHNDVFNTAHPRKVIKSKVSENIYVHAFINSMSVINTGRVPIISFLLPMVVKRLHSKVSGDE